MGLQSTILPCFIQLFGSTRAAALKFLAGEDLHVLPGLARASGRVRKIPGLKCFGPATRNGKHSDDGFMGLVPRRLTARTRKSDGPRKMFFLFQGCILRFHVNLPGCIYLSICLILRVTMDHLEFAEVK